MATLTGILCYTGDMTRKRRILIVSLLVFIIICLVIVGFVIKNRAALDVSGRSVSISLSTSDISARILDYGASICTMNVPSSDCGPYEVNVETSDGKRSTYTVAGFSNRASKRYDEIGLRIRSAKEQNSFVTLRVNNKNEIIAVY